MKSVHSKDEEMDSDNNSEDESENEEENNEWIIDIWDMLRNKAKNTNNSLKNVYKYYVLLVKSFKHNEIHQKVMETVKRAQDEDEMDFREALDYAISKRMFLINRCNISIGIKAIFLPSTIFLEQIFNNVPNCS